MFQQKSILERGLDKNAIPEHVGIIMDGNGRWAKKRGLPRMFGHRAGMEQLHRIVEFSNDIGIKALSVYAFSSENWKRPQEEVNGLMKLLIEFMKKEINELHAKNVKIQFMGEIEKLPKAVFEALNEASNKTEKNTGLILNAGVNYGSQFELIRACQLLAEDAKQGKIAVELIDEKAFEQKLYTANLPQLDLLVRTSGEQRLSNFMLFQCAYAEFVFSDILWPDFGPDAFTNVLQIFQSRNRRFGGL